MVTKEKTDPSERLPVGVFHSVWKDNDLWARVSYKRDETIYREGQAAESIYMVIDGAVALSHWN